MDILDLLRGDHDEARVIVDRLQEANGEQASRLLRELDALVRTHARAEQELVYPRARDQPVMVEEDLVEHETIEGLLDGLRGLDPDGIAFRGRVKFLRENIHHHADDEEENLLPLLEKTMSAEERSRLGEEVVRRKRELVGPTKQRLFEEVEQRGRR